jgi:hypothetical protein
MATETAGNGHYWRDAAGVWRYTISGRPVPGARPRPLLDGELPYCPLLDMGGVFYRVVPRWRVDVTPELARALAQEGVLAEDEDGITERFLVPAGLWPAWPDPAGGMWAPELAELVDSAGLAEFMGYSTVASVHQMLCRGTLPAPVLRLPAAGVPKRGAPPQLFWTRPVLEQWRAAYRAARPLRYDLERKLATERRRREERAQSLADAGQRIRRRRAAR